MYSPLLPETMRWVGMLLLLIVATSSSQNIELNSIGEGWVYDVVMTSSGYAATGCTEFNIGDDYSLNGSVGLFLFNTEFELKSKKSFTFRQKEDGNSICVLTDGRLVIGANVLETVDSVSGDPLPYGGWIIMTNAAGDSITSMFFQHTRLFTVFPLEDGGFRSVWSENYVPGSNVRDIVVKDFDSMMNVVTSHTILDSVNVLINNSTISADGGAILVGQQKGESTRGTDFLVCRLNNQGEMIWQRTYGGDNYDVAYDVAATTDGGFLVTGKYEVPYTFIAGYTFFFDDIWLLKINEQGDSVEAHWYGVNSLEEHGQAITAGFDGKYYITGPVKDNMFILCVDASGDSCWIETGNYTGDDIPYTIAVNEQNRIAAMGMRELVQQRESDCCCWLYSAKQQAIMGESRKRIVLSTGESASYDLLGRKLQQSLNYPVRAFTEVFSHGKEVSIRILVR